MERQWRTEQVFVQVNHEPEPPPLFFPLFFFFFHKIKMILLKTERNAFFYAKIDVSIHVAFNSGVSFRFSQLLNT